MKISDAKKGLCVQLTEDERCDVFFGLALVAQHHRDQIKDWRMEPTDGPRGKYYRDWKRHHACIIAHHEQRIAELSALVGRLGGRDWIAAAKAASRSDSDATPTPLSDFPVTPE